MRHARSILVVSLVCAAVVVAWYMLRRELPLAANATTAPERAEVALATPELVDPIAEPTHEAAERVAAGVEATAATQALETDDSTPLEFGALRGRVSFADELAGLEWRVRAERVPRSNLAKTADTRSFTGTACLDFDFDDLLVGWYTLRVECVQRLPPRSPKDGDGIELCQLVHVDYGVEVGASAPERPLEWDPLDLRGAYRLARYVLIDEVGVPWRGVQVDSHTDAESDFTSRTDEFGNVDILVAASTKELQLVLPTSDACTVKTPFTGSRSVVEMRRRPTLVLEIDTTLVPPRRWLAVVLHEVGADNMVDERTFAGADFDPVTGRATIRLSHAGTFGLSWQVRTTDQEWELFDSATRIDVRADAKPLVIRLDLPAEVRAALR